MKPVSKYIFWALIIGISCTLMKLYFGQQNTAQAEGQVTSWPWYFKVAFLGNVTISFAAVTSFFLYKQYFPKYVSACYVLLILCVVIASWGTFTKTFTTPTFFYSVKGVGTFINIGVLFFAADTKYFPRIVKFFYYACLFILAASVISLSKIGLGASRKTFLFQIGDYTVFLMWVFPYFFLQDEEDKKKNLLNLCLFLLIFVLVFSIGARSYLILYLLYVMSKFSKQLTTKTGIFTIIGLVILCVGAYFILLNSPFGSTMENAFNNLSERSGEDTRSEQIYEFLDQYDATYLFQGVGPLKQWFWSSTNDYYSYLDNQFLLIAWWAGLPAILIYVFLLVRSLFVKSEIQLFEKIKGIKLIIFLWILACLGFAIYCTLSSEPYYYFLSFLIGLNACQYTKLLGEEEQLENIAATDEEHEYS
jgi:hypothetical protein